MFFENVISALVFATAGAFIALSIRWAIVKLRTPKSNLVCIYNPGKLGIYMERDVFKWAIDFPADQWMQLRGMMIEWYQEHPDARACLVYPGVPDSPRFNASINFLELDVPGDSGEPVTPRGKKA